MYLSELLYIYMFYHLLNVDNQGQPGWDFEQPHLTETVPAYGRRVESTWPLVPSNHSMIPWFCLKSLVFLGKTMQSSVKFIHSPALDQHKHMEFQRKLQEEDFSSFLQSSYQEHPPHPLERYATSPAPGAAAWANEKSMRRICRQFPPHINPQRTSHSLTLT